MADESTGATPAPESASAPDSTPAATEDAPLGEAGQKALDAFKARAREAEAKLKELEPLAARAQELEDANKSELEKLTGKLSKTEKEAAEAKARLLRYEVAAEKEVPSKLVPLLTASSKEELEAQADLILENAKPAEPAPDFDGGAREPAPEAKTPEEQHNENVLALLGISPNS